MCKSHLLRLYVVKNLAYIGDDVIQTPDLKYHLPPIPGQSEFSLPVLTEIR